VGLGLVLEWRDNKISIKDLIPGLWCALYMCICVHLYMCMYMCTSIYIRILFIHVYTGLYMCSLYMHMCVSVFYVCAYVCI